MVQVMAYWYLPHPQLPAPQFALTAPSAFLLCALREVCKHAPAAPPSPARIVEQVISQFFLPFQILLLLLQHAQAFGFLGHDVNEADFGERGGALALVLSSTRVEGGVAAQDAVFTD